MTSKEKSKRQNDREKEERRKINEAVLRTKKRLTENVKHGNIDQGKENLIAMFPDMKDRIGRVETIKPKKKQPNYAIKLTW